MDRSKLVSSRAIAAIAGAAIGFFAASFPTQLQAANPIVGKCVPKLKAAKATGKHWTAFAANRANKAGQACGWAIGFPVREAAVSGALSECRASERDHPTWGERNTCSLVMVEGTYAFRHL